MTRKNGKPMPNAKISLFSNQGYQLRSVRLSEATDMIYRRIATWKRDASGRVTGCKLLFLDRMMETSPAAITAQEMRRIGLEDGASRTARMREGCKQQRERQGHRAEDAVERAQNKVQMWPVIPLTNPQRVEWALR